MKTISRSQFVQQADELFRVLEESAERDPSLTQAFEYGCVWYEYTAQLVAHFDSLVASDQLRLSEAVTAAKVGRAKILQREPVLA